MNVEVVYCHSEGHTLIRVRTTDTNTIRDVIQASRILERHPEIDLETNKVGVLGKLKKLETPVKGGERIEIYRRITCDPETVPRRDQD